MRGSRILWQTSMETNGAEVVQCAGTIREAWAMDKEENEYHWMQKSENFPKDGGPYKRYKRATLNELVMTGSEPSYCPISWLFSPTLHFTTGSWVVLDQNCDGPCFFWRVKNQSARPRSLINTGHSPKEDGEFILNSKGVIKQSSFSRCGTYRCGDVGHS